MKFVTNVPGHIDLNWIFNGFASDSVKPFRINLVTEYAVSIRVSTVAVTDDTLYPSSWNLLATDL